MATLTAMQPRPFIKRQERVEIELVEALPEDLKIFNAGKQKEELREGLIYWLRSSINGVIEKTPRILTAHCNPDDIKEWLDNNMILIARSEFN